MHVPSFVDVLHHVPARRFELRGIDRHQILQAGDVVVGVGECSVQPEVQFTHLERTELRLMVAA